jgi:CBS domain-containing protein
MRLAVVASGMPVSDVARTGVVTTHRDQSAGNLATVMTEEEVGSVVVEDDDRPVGIVTDRDLVVEVLEPRRDPTEVTAGEVMTETPVTVALDSGIFEATGTMFEHAVRRLPVVDADGALAGIVTLDDFLVMLTDELDDLAGVVEAESPPY